MHCSIFRNSVEPAFCVTFEADVTGFKKYTKENHVSFTLAMVHAICKCANQIEAFRYRFVDGIHIGEFVNALESYLGSF